MGLKGKIKGSYLYTQWKLGKYTKRRVKHSNIVNYNYEDDDDVNQGYPVDSNNSYATYPSDNGHHRHNKENYNQNVTQDDSNYYPPNTYNRMAYYPTMENE
eukprot:jgi/Orpsp1_1/1189369/evm.model.d7180000071478.1